MEERKLQTSLEGGSCWKHSFNNSFQKLFKHHLWGIYLFHIGTGESPMWENNDNFSMQGKRDWQGPNTIQLGHWAGSYYQRKNSSPFVFFRFHLSISELLFLFKNAFWWSGGKAWVFLEARTVLPSIFHIMTQVLYKMILEGHSGKDGWIVYGRSTGRAFQPLQSSSVLTIDPQDVPVCLPARCSGLERAKSHHPQLWTHRFIIEG